MKCNNYQVSLAKQPSTAEKQGTSGVQNSIDKLGRAMCSVEEAYSMFWQAEEGGGAPVTQDRRRKKKRRQLLPPEPSVIEPDRPAHRPLPPGELLGGARNEGYTDTATPSAMLGGYDMDQHFPHPSSDVDSQTVYNLEPDWAQPFNSVGVPDWIKERMPKRDAETPLIPSPWVDGQPSLWQSVPDGLRTQFNVSAARTAAENRTDDLERRLNSMFSKLDDMEAGRLANNHMEILMFILGGFVLLLLLDLIVKQGTQATVLLAAAGGRAMFGGGRGLLWTQ